MRLVPAVVALIGLGIPMAGAGAQPNPFGDPAVLEAECAADNFESCLKLANYLVTRNSPESKARSVVITTATCEKGHLPSCGDLAAAYALGLGVEQDEARAHAIDLDLCDNKDYGPACTAIGFDYALGKAGLEEDDSKALPYFVRGCDLGDAGGCQRAGQHWNNLLNPARDTAKAKAYYQRGCDLGDTYACNDLRRMQEK